MQGSILEIRFMVLVCTTLPMGTVMKVRGTKGGSKVTECIRSGAVRGGVANGTVGILRLLFHL